MKITGSEKRTCNAYSKMHADADGCLMTFLLHLLYILFLLEHRQGSDVAEETQTEAIRVRVHRTYSLMMIVKRILRFTPRTKRNWLTIRHFLNRIVRASRFVRTIRSISI